MPDDNSDKDVRPRDLTKNMRGFANVLELSPFDSDEEEDPVQLRSLMEIANECEFSRAPAVNNNKKFIHD